MAQNITLLNIQYSDVGAVTLPKTGGGLAAFTDVTDTTAAAEDVASGKYFYTAAGVKTEGTASGGGGGVSGLTYYNTISVYRDGRYAQPTFPVVAGRSMIAICPDERDGGVILLYASFSTDSTKYDYGYISCFGRDSNSYRNYAVTTGATEMTPARFQVFKTWVEAYTITDVPLYLIDNT